MPIDHHGVKPSGKNLPAQRVSTSLQRLTRMLIEGSTSVDDEGIIDEVTSMLGTKLDELDFCILTVKIDKESERMRHGLWERKVLLSRSSTLGSILRRLAKDWLFVPKDILCKVSPGLGKLIWLTGHICSEPPNAFSYLQGSQGSLSTEHGPLLQRRGGPGMGRIPTLS